MKLNVWKRSISFLLVAGLSAMAPLCADTVILHDGSSYSGRFLSDSAQQLTFTGTQGVQYTFPQKDVQSIVFTSSTDVVTLKTGKTYSGQYTGNKMIDFEDGEGVRYQFPLADVSSVVFSGGAPGAAGGAHGAGARVPPGAKVIPPGAQFSIRVDESIDSNNSSPGQLYSATVNQDVYDVAGALSIPQGSRAKVIVRNIDEGSSGTPELVLDLFSVTVNGRRYRVGASDVYETNRRGIGANRRTAEYGGGGAGLGALVGAIFGGGRGAAIGTASGAAGGLLTQFFTRGKEVKVPAETVLMFRLNRRLVLREGGNGDGSESRGGNQR